MSLERFHGYYTALLTPFVNGAVDEKNFQKIVAWQIDQGIHGVVPCGTTGESPTLSDEEYGRVTTLCVEVAKGRVPVVAGCGSNSTAHAVHLTRQAEKLGVDAALHVVPYYNKPTQEGLYQHYKAIHDQTGLPIIIYNIPSRSIVNMSVETMARLSELPRIVGVKDSSGEVTRPARTRVTCKTEFRQFTGDDPVALPFLAQGGHGCISVTSNIAPSLCAALYNAWVAGDRDKAARLHEQLLPLHDALFSETSPGPVKYAAALLGLCRYEFRLPLVPISKVNEKLVEAAMNKVGLLSADAVLKPLASA